VNDAAGQRARILVVDDVPANVRMLAMLLKTRGYEVITAACGQEGLDKTFSEQPDLVLLDVMMPDINGYDVCAAIRANPATQTLPVVMVTALDQPEERVKGIEAGCDDFISKPVSPPEVLARVKSLLRIRRLHEQVQRQADELREWNRTLEQRVLEGAAHLQRMDRLKRFFSAHVAEQIVSGEAEDPLKSRRCELVVVFLDMRGYTSFVETADPEEIMSVLDEYHAEMGRLVMAADGTLERFAGDGIMIFFNDVIVLPNAAETAIRMSLEMQQVFTRLNAGWKKRGYDLNMGIGIAKGYATVGRIGFPGRWDYGAIGAVSALAARLCGEAKAGQVLVSQRVLGAVEDIVEVEPVGPLTLKGFHKPVPAFNVVSVQPAAASVPQS
jgi:DNA-binding response OmpR family regulator